MNIQLTDHARTRSQQRAIPEVVLESLLSMGKTAHDHRGSCIVYFDHRAKSRLRHLWGESDYRRYENKPMPTPLSATTAASSRLAIAPVASRAAERLATPTSTRSHKA